MRPDSKWLSPGAHLIITFLQKLREFLTLSIFIQNAINKIRYVKKLFFIITQGSVND